VSDAPSHRNLSEGIKLTFRTLEDWGSRPADAVAQPLPIAIAFFTPNSVKAFLLELLTRGDAAEEDDEGWDLPDSVKKSVLRDGDAAQAGGGAK
jgi:hypothetical protein